MRPCPPDSNCESYPLMILFWIFGFGPNFIHTSVEFYNQRMRKMKTKKMDFAFMFFIYSIGLFMFVCFQIPFFCLITPFILVSLIYRNFFYSFIYFLGVGLGY